MKRIFSTILAICVLNVAVAQVSANFGVEAGTTYSRIRSIAFLGGEVNEFPYGGGFYVGGFAHINGDKKFSVQTGIRYSSNKTFENTEILALPGLVAKGNVTMSYVEIPLNLTFKSEKCKKWAAYMGPQIKYALSGHRKFKFYNYPITPVDEDLKFGSATTEYKRLQLAYVVGIERMISKKVKAVAAYQFGANDIDNTKDYETKFNSFRLGLKYQF